jgi:hypothetical protein
MLLCWMIDSLGICCVAGWLFVVHSLSLCFPALASGVFGFCVFCIYLIQCTCPSYFLFCFHSPPAQHSTKPSLLPKKSPLPNLKSLQNPLPIPARLLNQTPLPPMLQIHAPSLILPLYMRHIDRNENISLLPLQPNERQQNRHEIRLVGAALLFGAGRRGCDEVVDGGVGPSNHVC